MSRAEGIRWLGKADENLKLALLALRNRLYALSCFHSQQAAEFSLKGLLIGLTGVHLMTHSIARLAAEAKASVKLNLPLESELNRLEDHYLQARYPNARISPYGSVEAEEAYRVAEAVVDECGRAIKEAEVPG